MPNGRIFAKDALATRTPNVIRRRPIPRFRSYPEVSQHWTLSEDGSYRIYSDGREVSTRRLYSFHPAGESTQKPC